MGEVYRAKDTRLPREVAIKVSAQRFSERFAGEAPIIASLNHPNISTLYDVGDDYLVMEIVEGLTLADKIRQRPLTLDEASAIARQIVDALDYAHERGVVHRDLKPGNVKIRPDGVVKVLDFGLAKSGVGRLAEAAEAVTVAGPQTEVGVVLGTAAYMAPEQATGQVVDRRADIWAFGCLFYEMLAGAPPHLRDTSQETMASILRDDPDLNKVSAQAHRLLKRCLEKDPQKRPRHIGDVMSLLDDSPSGQYLVIDLIPRDPRERRFDAEEVAVASSPQVLPCWPSASLSPYGRRGGVGPSRCSPSASKSLNQMRCSLSMAAHGRIARRPLAGVSSQRRGRRGPLLAAVARHGRSARAPGDRRRVRAGRVDVRQPVCGIHASRRRDDDADHEGGHSGRTAAGAGRNARRLQRRHVEQGGRDSFRIVAAWRSRVSSSGCGRCCGACHGCGRGRRGPQIPSVPAGWTTVSLPEDLSRSRQDGCLRRLHRRRAGRAESQSRAGHEPSGLLCPESRRRPGTLDLSARWDADGTALRPGSADAQRRGRFNR